MSPHNKLLEVLNAISKEMTLKGLWQSTAPSNEALSSTQPFCVDTLTFCEWMQWIMLPKLEKMAKSGAALPSKSDMFSMAEEAFKRVEVDTKMLLSLVLKLDHCLRVTH